MHDGRNFVPCVFARNPAVEKLLAVGSEIQIDVPVVKHVPRCATVLFAENLDRNALRYAPQQIKRLYIQQISPSRTTTNGWVTWKTADGKILEEKWNALLKKSDDAEQLSRRKKHKKKSRKTSAVEVSEAGGNDILYHFAKGGAIVAKIRRVGSQFVLLAGSKLSLKYDFRGSGWMNVRKNASVGADGTLREDIECDSPSMAAALVAGGARNGLTFWKNKDRKELKSLGK